MKRVRPPSPVPVILAIALVFNSTNWALTYMYMQRLLSETLS